MSLFLDVEPRLTDGFAERIAEAVSSAVEMALRNVLAGLCLTPDERLAVEIHRAQRDVAAVDHEIRRRSAHERIADALHARDDAGTDEPDNGV